MVENKPLARALYAEVEIGDNVPMIYWEAIAQILARIRTMDEQQRQADEQRRRVDGIGA
jgi:flagellar biosynthetic protein FlhB